MTPEEARIAAAQGLARSKPGSLGYDATLASMNTRQANKVPNVRSKRKPTPTSKVARRIPYAYTGEDDTAQGGKPMFPSGRIARETAAFWKPRIKEGYQNVVDYYGQDRRAPAATTRQPAGSTAPVMSGPTRGNVEDFLGENAGLHVRGGQSVEGPRILNRTPMAALEQGPITPRTNMTNLTGERMQAGFRGDLPDTQFDFGEGNRRPMDRLDEAVYTPRGGGPAVNTTDAYIADRLAGSKHRQEMTRLAGRASERAGDGQVRTLGQGTSRGLYGALARMGGKKAARRLGQGDRKLDLQERAMELESVKANAPKSLHPLEAQKLQAETLKLGAEAMAQQTPKEKQLFEEKMAKDRGLLELYKELSTAVGRPAQENIKRAIDSYKSGKAFELYVRPENQ